MLFSMLYVRPPGIWLVGRRQVISAFDRAVHGLLTRATYQDSDSLTEGEDLATSLRQVRLAGLFDRRRSLFGTFPIQNFGILC
jgi:hypothetical protein